MPKLITSSNKEWDEQRKFLAEVLYVLDLKEINPSISGNLGLSVSSHPPHRVTYQDFCKSDPTTFHGEARGDVVNKDDIWLIDMESQSKIFRCHEDEQVLFASSILRDSTKLWRENLMT